MATLSALMTMTKSPPSTLGVNVGLCLPRNRLAAATASRPSTTSVASMTYHERVVSPAFGVYVDTALPLLNRVESRSEHVSYFHRRIIGCRGSSCRRRLGRQCRYLLQELRCSPCRRRDADHAG